jgi:hypothetical protein
VRDRGPQDEFCGCSFLLSGEIDVVSKSMKGRGLAKVEEKWLDVSEKRPDWMSVSSGGAKEVLDVREQV